MTGEGKTERSSRVEVELEFQTSELVSAMMLAESDGVDLDRLVAKAVLYYVRARGFSSKMKGLTRAKWIIGVTAEMSGVDIEKLLAGDRRREYVIARQTAMFLVCEYAGLSYPRTGKLFGDRHHTTVLYACKKVRLESDPDVLQLVHAVEAELGLSRFKAG